jgi:type III secretory pathway component EscR
MKIVYIITHAVLGTMTLPYVIVVHDTTLLQAMFLHTPLLRDVTSLHRDAWFSRRKLGSFDMMSLIRVRFSLKLQVGLN